MSTDLVSWLRSQLDTDEEHARSEMAAAWLPTHWAALIRRTVAAHRAILDDFADIQSVVDDPSNDEATRATYVICLRVLDLPIRRIVSIYEDRPGFVPSWRAE